MQTVDEVFSPMLDSRVVLRAAVHSNSPFSHPRQRPLLLMVRIVQPGGEYIFTVTNPKGSGWAAEEAEGRTKHEKSSAGEEIDQ